MRRRTVVAVATLLAVIVASRWYLLRINPTPRESTGVAVSDYTLTNFTLRAMDENGLPRFAVTGPFLQENGGDGSATVESPQMQLFDAGTKTWTASAAEGWVAPNGEQVRLQGDVVLVSPEGQRNARIDTQSLVVHTRTSTATSDEEVTITRPGIQLSGVGAQVDMAAQSYELRGRVRARYGDRGDAAG